MSAAGRSHATSQLSDQTVWRSAMYQVLAQAFSYPEPDTVDALRADLDSLCEHELTNRVALRPAAEALREAVESATPEALAATYNQLFAGEVPCSPCETEYEFDGFAKARQLADIAGFYRAFGLKVSSNDAAPADSIATECEFMSHVTLKDAFAATQGWDERRTVAWDAERAFVEDHLGRWVPLFCRTLVTLDEIDSFYGAAACLCDAFVAQEIQLTGARPLPAMSRATIADRDDPFTCVFAAPEIEGEEDQQ